MGELYVAVGPDEAPCVIKRMLAQHLNQPDYVRMFLAEARLLQRLRHPNIVDVHEVGEVDGQPFFVMELVEGRSLRDLLDALSRAGKSLPVRHVVDIGLQLLQALEYAHRATDEGGRELGIVHRDINPHNVLIGWDGSIKLIDFGIAKSDVSGHDTAVGTIKGKFAYMSPEQSAADPLDARSDLFSAAIVLYEALTLDNPFARPNVVLALEAIQLHPVAPPSALRSDAAALDDPLLRALEKNPDLRFPSAAAFADALAQSRHELPAEPAPLPALLRALFGAEAPSEVPSTAAIARGRAASSNPDAPAALAEPARVAEAPTPSDSGAVERPGPAEATPPASASDAPPRAVASEAPFATPATTAPGLVAEPDSVQPARATSSEGTRRRPRSGLGYAALLVVTTLVGFGLTRALMLPSGPADGTALGALRIDAEPPLWVRLSDAHWFGTPLRARLMEPDGELEVRADAGPKARVTFQIRDGALRLRTPTPGWSLRAVSPQAGAQRFELATEDGIVSFIAWTPTAPPSRAAAP